MHIYNLTLFIKYYRVYIFFLPSYIQYVKITILTKYDDLIYCYYITDVLIIYTFTITTYILLQNVVIYRMFAYDRVKLNILYIY